MGHQIQFLALQRTCQEPHHVPGETHTITTVWAQQCWVGCDPQVRCAQHSTGGTCAEDSKQRRICTSHLARRCSRQDQGSQQSSSSKSTRLFPTNLLKYEEGTKLRTFSPQAQDKPGGRKLNQSQQIEASRAVPGKTSLPYAHPWPLCEESPRPVTVLINSSPVCLFQGHFSAGIRREHVGSGELHPPHEPMGLAPTRKLQEGCGCPVCPSYSFSVSLHLPGFHCAGFRHRAMKDAPKHSIKSQNQ